MQISWYIKVGFLFLFCSKLALEIAKQSAVIDWKSVNPCGVLHVARHDDINSIRMIFFSHDLRVHLAKTRQKSVLWRNFEDRFKRHRYDIMLIMLIFKRVWWSWPFLCCIDLSKKKNSKNVEKFANWKGEMFGFFCA